MAEKTNLQREDFSKWYIQTIQKADLMDYSPVRGCMIFKPDGYEIWEHIQEEFNRRFKEEGIRNAYFPDAARAAGQSDRCPSHPPAGRPGAEDDRRYRRRCRWL